MPSSTTPNPQYIVERWPHGWLMLGPPGGRGIPADALSECSKMFPRDAVMCPGISSHYCKMGRDNVVICVATLSGMREWMAEIEAAIAHVPTEQRWLVGLDTGSSSLAMFAVLAANEALRNAALESCRGDTPRDADDFGRCRRLIARFPEWRGRLHEVASAYPETKWPQIIARWDELEAASMPACTKILSDIHHPQPPPTHAQNRS